MQSKQGGGVARSDSSLSPGSSLARWGMTGGPSLAVREREGKKRELAGLAKLGRAGLRRGEKGEGDREMGQAEKGFWAGKKKRK